MMKSVDNGHPLMNQQNLMKFGGARTPAGMMDIHGKSTLGDHQLMDVHLNSNELFKANDTSNLDFVFHDGQEKGGLLEFQQKSPIPSFGFNQGKQLLGLQDGEGLSRQAVHQQDPHTMLAYGNKHLSRGVDLGFGNDDGINHIIQGDRVLNVHHLQNQRQYWRTYENSRVPSLNGRASGALDS